jgi:hypothetical protein
MPVVVLNVRPSRQRTFHTVRADRRNGEIALKSIGEKALLYAPADEPRHGYFALASIIDIAPDIRHRRFIFISLEDVELFTSFHPLESLVEPIESRAYHTPGAIEFSYFSLGIRALSPKDQDAARDLARRARGCDQTNFMFPGLATPPSPAFHEDLTTMRRPSRATRAVTIRNRQLRWTVLEAYGAACAVCGDDDAVPETGTYEVEVCHLRGLDLGGPDALSNAMPMCRKHHWAYDYGLFTLTDAGEIVPSRQMGARLRLRFNGWTRALFPQAVAAWPRVDHLRFHRANVFLR